MAGTDAERTPAGRRPSREAAPPENGCLDAFQSAADGGMVMAPDGRILHWNRAAEGILGHTAREVVGRTCFDVVCGQDDRGNRVCFERCFVMRMSEAGEPVQSFDVRTRTKDGRPVWLNTSTFRVEASSEAGGPLIVHMFRDVTTQHEIVEMIRGRRAPAPPADAAGALTRREAEILRLLATGVGTRAAADRLHVSPVTVRNHVQRILGKLGVHSRLAAVTHAMERGLI